MNMRTLRSYNYCMTRIFPWFFLLLVAFVASGCGNKTSNSGPAPTASVLLSDGIKALQTQTSAHSTFKVDITGAPSPQKKVDAKQKAIKALFANPISFSFDGSSGKSAIDGSFKLAFGGKNYKAGVRSDGSNAYLNYDGAWYQSTTKKIVEGAQSQTGKKTDVRGQLKKLEASVAKYADTVVTATVKDDGDDWTMTGKFSSEGIIKVVKETDPSAKALTGDERKTLDALAKALTFSASFNKDSKLLSRMNLNLVLDKETLSQLKTQAKNNNQLPFEQLAVKIQLTADEYGKEVKIEKPANAQPIQSVFLKLLGDLGSNPVIAPLLANAFSGPSNPPASDPNLVPPTINVP